MAAATKELMWLNEKEEEEVGFDWSDRNTNMAAKKESYSVGQPFLLSMSTLSLPTHTHPYHSQCWEFSLGSVKMGVGLGLHLQRS